LQQEEFNNERTKALTALTALTAETECSRKYGLGSEHYRYGAFRWWLAKNESFLIEKLKKVMEKDSDEMVKWAMSQDLRGK